LNDRLQARRFGILAAALFNQNSGWPAEHTSGPTGSHCRRLNIRQAFRDGLAANTLREGALRGSRARRNDLPAQAETWRSYPCFINTPRLNSHSSWRVEDHDGDMSGAGRVRRMTTSRLAALCCSLCIESQRSTIIQRRKPKASNRTAEAKATGLEGVAARDFSTLN
jgi:hypothetical protein